MIRRHALLLALLGALMFYSLALSQGWLDRVPPEVYAEVPARTPAGEPFQIFLSASEPVIYTLRYGDEVREETAQNLELTLEALAGDHTLTVTARDGADNETTVAYEVTGIPALRPQLGATESATAGDPVSVRITLPPTPPIRSLTVRLDGELLPTFRSGDSTGDEAGNSVVALAGVPLGSEGGVSHFEVTLTDEFGRETRLERPLEVAADPRPVEELAIAPSVLSASTPANRELEADVLTDAYRAGVADPLWRDPFLLPVEGSSTSSFGSPRRYAPGGGVSYHQGADIAAPEGTPIVVTNDGVVRVAGFYPIKGGLTVIDHGGGVSSLYFHQSVMQVAPEQRVRRGEQIGEVGTTGLSTGPHLHWEMRVNTLPTNPFAWVGKVLP